MRSYTELLKTEAAKGNFNFRNFITGLNREELYDFVEDVLAERTKDMQFAFPPSKNISTHDIVFSDMVELPYKTYQSVKEFLDDIFLSAIRGVYPNSQDVIDNILGLTMLRKEGVSAKCMKNSLKNPSVDNDTKLSLAFLLSKIEDKVPLSYWETEIDYKKYPFLIPAYISAYAKINPKKALKGLDMLRQQPDSFRYFRTPVTSALKKMLIEDENYSDYSALYFQMPEWVQLEFDAILKTPRFDSVREEAAAAAKVAAAAKKETDFEKWLKMLLKNLTEKMILQTNDYQNQTYINLTTIQYGKINRPLCRIRHDNA
jgi:hypothetical protein